MTEFAYNNAKNASTSYMSFKFNCGNYLWVLNKKNFDPRSKLKSVGKLFFEFQNLMVICQQNFNHTQELQKQAQNKSVKP